MPTTTLATISAMATERGVALAWRACSKGRAGSLLGSSAKFKAEVTGDLGVEGWRQGGAQCGVKCLMLDLTGQGVVWCNTNGCYRHSSVAQR